MTATDAQLLADFANRRDEAAFRELTRRHLGLVFHTALRCTGNRALSEEIAQNVLCAVAAKAASLARNPERFAAWLHRAAVFESSKAMRKETSHQRRSRLQHPDTVSATIEENDGLWQTALPLLDTALDSLPESDRQVVVLHFFERQPFAQIGALLDKTPAAVQKQSVRALEKLARILKRKGVAIPVGLLATGLAIESAKAAPAALVTAVTSAGAAAKAGKPLLSSLSVMTGSHHQALLTCLLVTMALPVAWQRIEISKVESKLSSLRSNAATPVPSPALPTPGTATSLVSRSMDLPELVMEAKRSQNSEALKLALRRKLETAEPEVLGNLLSSLRAEDLQETDRFVLGGLLARALSRKDLHLAMEKIGEGWIVPGGGLYGDWVTDLFHEFVRTDRHGATEWLLRIQHNSPYSDELAREALEAGRSYASYSSSPFGDGSLVPLQADLLSTLVANDPDGASRFLRSFPDHTLQGALIAKALVPVGVADETQAEIWLALIRTLDGGERKTALAKLGQSALAGSSADMQLETATPLIRTADATWEERREMAIAVVRTFLSNKETPVIRDRNAEVLQWLSEGFTADEAQEIAMPVRAEIDRYWASRAGSILDQIEQMPDARSRETALQIFFQNQVFKGEQLDRALRLAGAISDPAVRERIVQQLTENSKR